MNLKRYFVPHLLIITTFVAVSLLLVGYRFGDGDQNSHIPFLLKDINPNLYPNNQFIELRNDHYSYLRTVVAWLIESKIAPLEIVYFGLFVFVKLLYFQANYDLLGVFVINKNLRYLFLAVFVIPVFSFTIFPTNENYTVDRVVALPLLIFSLSYFLRNQYVRSVIFLGIAYNLHPLSSTFVLAMFVASLFDSLLKHKVELRSVLLYLGIFGVIALPVLVWKFGGSGFDISVNWDWFQIISKGVLWQVFHIFSLNPPTIILSILGLGNTYVFWWILKKEKRWKVNDQERKLIIFIATIYLIIFSGVFIYNYLPLVTAVQFQLPRAGMFIPVLLYPYVAGFVYRQYKKNKISKRFLVGITLVTVISGWLVTPLVYYILILKKKLHWRYALVVTNTAIYLVGLWVGYRYSVWKPGVYIYPINNSWYDVQIWAKDNTSPEAMFITPVDKWSHYYSDFIVFSQRSNVVTLGELFEIAFHPKYIATWKKRFEDVVPGAIDQFTTNFDENRKIVDDIYNQNTTEDFLKIAQKYNAKYVIVEKPKELGFNKIYENAQYRVYTFSGEQPK